MKALQNSTYFSNLDGFAKGSAGSGKADKLAINTNISKTITRKYQEEVLASFKAIHLYLFKPTFRFLHIHLILLRLNISLGEYTHKSCLGCTQT